MTRPVVERLKEILKNSFNPILKEWGFKKKGLKYQLSQKDLIWEVIVYKSQWNTHKKLSFTTEIAIYGNPNNPPLPPSFFQGPLIHGRLADLLVRQGPDIWFDLEEDEGGAEEKDKEIADKLKDVVMPLFSFMQKYPTLKSIIALMEAPKGHTGLIPSPQASTLCLSIAYLLAGEQEKGFAILDEAIQCLKSKKRSSDSVHYFQELRDQLAREVISIT